MKELKYKHLDETIYTEKLTNGLTVFLLPRPEMSKVYGFFSTNYGSIDQTFVPLGKDEFVTVPEGVAHFLEHKLFEKKDGDVFTDFSAQGASANAFTSNTQTAYMFTATERIEENIETLIDFVQEPYFTDESVEREKGIIGQEIQMYMDQPDHRMYMNMLQAMFKNHPVRQEVLGTKESVYSITKEDLYTCYQTFYHPENMTLFIAGNIDVPKTMKLIKDNQTAKSFMTIDKIKRFMPNEPKTVATHKQSIQMNVATPKVMVGMKEYAHELEKEELLKRSVLQGMLLEHFFSSSGEFYEELYDSGLIDNSFFLQTSVEKDHGYSIIGGNTSEPEKLAQQVIDLLKTTNSYQLTDEAFERMKRKSIGQVLHSMNSLEYITQEYIHHNRLGFDFFELIPFIQSLKLEDATSFLENWISEDRIVISEVLPLEA